MLKEEATIRPYGPTGPEVSTLITRGTTTGSGQNQHKRHPWSDHCRKPGHTKDICWEIHRKPADWKPRQNNCGYQTTVEHKGEKLQEVNNSNSSSRNAFNSEQLKLYKIFSSFQTSGQSSSNTNTPFGSLAHKGNFFRALSTTSRTKTQIIDSGASDHMTDSYHLFSSYSPCAGNLKVKIANGSLSFVARKGNIQIFDSITLRVCPSCCKLVLQFVIHQPTN